MMRVTWSLMVFLILANANEITITPDGSYVEGNSFSIAPDGSYTSGPDSVITPDGSYLGSNPKDYEDLYDEPLDGWLPDN